jgi:hypothetical protein
MRVIQVTQFGGPEMLTLGEAPDPVAGTGEAVIAAWYAGRPESRQPPVIIGPDARLGMPAGGAA